MIRRYAVGLGLCVVTVMLLCGLAWQATKPANGGIAAVGTVAAKATLPIVACNGDKAGDFACQQQYYTAVTRSKGVAAAMVELKAAYKVNPYVQSNCHQFTHVIGREAGNLYGDVGQAYEHGDNFCSSGYYHGVMETIAAKVGEKNLNTEANKICASVAAKGRYALEHYNCVHGMGHGFMALTGDELFKSLSYCDYLSDSWEALSCYSGVFMENVMTEFNSFHHSNYLKPEQPLYPCTDVADKYKNPCYLIQSSYALKLDAYDFSKVFEQCGQVGETAYRETCYQSVGRDASGTVNSDPVRTKANCELAQNAEARLNCVIGAVKDIIYYYHSDVQGLAFCQSLSADVRPTCATTAKEYYKTF